MPRRSPFRVSGPDYPFQLCLPNWRLKAVQLCLPNWRLKAVQLILVNWRLKAVQLILVNWRLKAVQLILVNWRLKRPATHGLAAFRWRPENFSYCRLHFVGRYEIIHPVFDKRKSEAARRLKTQESPNVFPHPMRTVPCAHF